MRCMAFYEKHNKVTQCKNEAVYPKSYCQPCGERFWVTGTLQNTPEAKFWLKLQKKKEKKMKTKKVKKTVDEPNVSFRKESTIGKLYDALAGGKKMRVRDVEKIDRDVDATRTINRLRRIGKETKKFKVVFDADAGTVKMLTKRAA